MSERPPHEDTKHEVRDGRRRFVMIYHSDLATLAEIGPSALTVYAFLAKYANYSDGTAFPSIDTLSGDCHMSRNTVIKAIRSLVHAKLIKVEKVQTQHGFQRSIYTVLSKNDTPQFNNCTEPGAKNEPSPVQNLHPNDNQVNDTQENKSVSPLAFDEFWKAYPRKDAKQDAVKAFGKIDWRKTTPDDLMLALAAFKQSDDWKEKGGKFIPYAATWLNGKRYLDEIPELEDARYYAGQRMEREQEAPEDMLARLVRTREISIRAKIGTDKIDRQIAELQAQIGTQP